MDHQYCLFYKNKKLNFGWIREVRKNKLVVVPENGKEFNCSSKQTEYIWPAKEYQSEQEAIPYLTKKATWVLEEASNIDIEVIYELCEPEEAHTLEDLAENFLDDPEDGWLRVALLLALKNNSRIFQQRKNQFAARSEEEIQKLDTERQRKEELQLRENREEKWAEQLLDQSTPEIQESEQQHWTQFLQRLKNFLLYLDDSQEKAHFCKIFQCNLRDALKTESTILSCLKQANVPISWGRVLLERASITTEFEQEELTACEQIDAPDIWKSCFNLETRDQRQLTTYSVDNEETKDFDDAFSWEEQEDGIILRIHIADVASYITPDLLLFSKAEERISSLYTLKQVYPMLPHALSEITFSLTENDDRPVMTFEIQIDGEGKITGSDFYRSVICVDKNLSYQFADQAIEQGESFWPVLWDFCQGLKKERLENGALELDRIEVKLDISKPDSIQISRVRENTPASMMIQELAIYTNYLAAKFCTDADLACLFRNQPPYSIVSTLAEGVKPKLQDLRIQPAHISLEAEGHSALGLECYLQATSPIRRFLDLICQGVIFNQLAKEEPLYTEEELLRWGKRGEELQRQMNKVERGLLNYWKLKYLAQHLGEEMEGQFLRTLRNGKALINLLPLQLNIEATLEELEKDEIIPLLIEAVEPSLQKVSVSRVQTLEPEQEQEQEPEQEPEQQLD
ncbi:MAG: hypothetical protein COB67_05985 [SAR324 cluster bacterium]|uniref:RNB domain-containing protein n=1 Tax=SAR324 cluster bacterium TaxID=2024889 RepID=A0A2A4T5N2_9DELT|nr:MAG: hypothetical protein COB67_05985 [SAR324 cluster bacterium]